MKKRIIMIIKKKKKIKVTQEIKIAKEKIVYQAFLINLSAIKKKSVKKIE